MALQLRSPHRHTMITRSQYKFGTRYGIPYYNWKMNFTSISRLFMKNAWKKVTFDRANEDVIDCQCFTSTSQPVFGVKNPCAPHAARHWWYEYYLVICQQCEVEYPIVSGSYVCYLRNKTTKYNDVDFFIPREYHDAVMSALREKIREKLSKGFLSTIRLCASDDYDPSAFTCYRVYGLVLRDKLPHFWKTPPMNLIFFPTQNSIFGDPGTGGDHDYTETVLIVLRNFDLDLPKVALKNLTFGSSPNDEKELALSSDLITLSIGLNDFSRQKNDRQKKYFNIFSEDLPSLFQPCTLGMLAWEKCRSMCLQVEKDSVGGKGINKINEMPGALNLYRFNHFGGTGVFTPSALGDGGRIEEYDLPSASSDSLPSVSSDSLFSTCDRSDSPSPEPVGVDVDGSSEDSFYLLDN